MNALTRRVILWSPRILTFAFALFLSIFALDVFDEPMGMLERAGALAAHLIPTGLVLLGLALAWRREWIAAVVFPLLAGWHLYAFWGRLHWSAYLAIEGPLVLMAGLFLLSWWARQGPGLSSKLAGTA